MKRTLFLVANPTHYINALELTETFKDRFGQKTLVMLTEFTGGINTIDQILQNDPWEEKHFINLNDFPVAASTRKGWQLCYKKIESFLGQFTYDYLVVGNLGDSIFYSVILKFRKKIKKIIALDDGTPSIKILNARHQKKDYWRFHFRSPRIVSKLLFGIKIFFPFYAPPQEVEFFTIFHLKGSLNDTIVQNNLTILKKLYQDNQIDSNKAYFVGSHLVDKGLVSERTYLSELKKIKAYHDERNQELKYIKHRAESDKILKKIEQIVPIKTYNSPLEFALAEEALPGEISSFFSSALFTLRKIHSSKIKIKAYKFDPSEILGSSEETPADILTIYDTMALDKEMEVVPLSSI